MTAVTSCRTASVCWLRGRRGSRAVGTGARTTLPRFATTVLVVCRFSLFMGLRIVMSTGGAARSPWVSSLGLLTDLDQQEAEVLTTVSCPSFASMPRTRCCSLLRWRFVCLHERPF